MLQEEFNDDKEASADELKGVAWTGMSFILFFIFLLVGIVFVIFQ